jgi:hypothetical protein
LTDNLAVYYLNSCILLKLRVFSWNGALMFIGMSCHKFYVPIFSEICSSAIDIFCFGSENQLEASIHDKSPYHSITEAFSRTKRSMVMCMLEENSFLVKIMNLT